MLLAVLLLVMLILSLKTRTLSSFFKSEEECQLMKNHFEIMKKFSGQASQYYVPNLKATSFFFMYFMYYIIWHFQLDQKKFHFVFFVQLNFGKKISYA